MSSNQLILETMRKYFYEKLYLLFVVFSLLTGCNSGVTIEGRLINALTNEPLVRKSIVVEGLRTIETDENGYFKINRLQSFQEYNYNIRPESYTSVSINIRNNENKDLIEAGTFMVVPEPPASGVFTYDKGQYFQIPEKQAIRYHLKYGAPGEIPDGFAQSGDGRLAAYYLNDNAISSLPQIIQGVPIVIWQKSGSNGNNYYCGIASLYKQEKRIITGNSCGSIQQAIIPEGWYLGLKDLTIGEYNIYCYAPLKYTIEKLSFETLQCINGQGFSVIKTTFSPGKYSLLSSDMDWDRSSSVSSVNGVVSELTSSVSVFELINK